MIYPPLVAGLVDFVASDYLGPVGNDEAILDEASIGLCLQQRGIGMPPVPDIGDRAQMIGLSQLRIELYEFDVLPQGSWIGADEMAVDVIFGRLALSRG